MTFERIDGVGEVTVRIEGALDAASAPQLKTALEKLAAEQPAKVICDLSALRLIDSAGVGSIVALYKRMQVYGGVLKVQGLRDQPLAIFKVLRLERVFDL
jgi:anti-sigma B factor antagonist